MEAFPELHERSPTDDSELFLDRLSIIDSQGRDRRVYDLTDQSGREWSSSS